MHRCISGLHPYQFCRYLLDIYLMGYISNAHSTDWCTCKHVDSKAITQALECNRIDKALLLTCFQKMVFCQCMYLTSTIPSMFYFSYYKLKLLL
ncbi:hypothetical protein PRUPE_8G070400 [Prunus persica]|uniref:Uncharacterized protein n=1 Tax=Prunus persica TaxID=3760 RepID=A0A251MUE5_PRUPE|nr:hypothetical protein PRUPE_8G070400 [Prunus persica]